jgi:hypothetical protein
VRDRGNGKESGERQGEWRVEWRIVITARRVENHKESEKGRESVLP